MNPAIAVAMTFLLGVFYSWTSRLNSTFFFGRTVSEELRSSAEARSITREYLLSVASATLASAVLGWFAVHAGSRPYLPAGPFFLCVLFILIFGRANTRVRNLLAIHSEWSGHTSSVRAASLLAQPPYWVPGALATLLPVIVSSGALIAAVLVASNGAGFRSGWAAFTAGMDGQGYSGILGLATGMLCSAVGMLAIFRASARLRTRMAQYTVRACITLAWVATALLVVTLACNAFGLVITRSEMKVVMIAALASALVVMAWNQARYKRFVPAAVEMGQDDRWRLGLFYADRNDPALFVQSRCGAGYTLNYGRAAAWPISIGLLVYFVGTMLLLPAHSH